MYFCINEFEFGVNDSIFSGNEQQKVYLLTSLVRSVLVKYRTSVFAILENIGPTFHWSRLHAWSVSK